MSSNVIAIDPGAKGGVAVSYDYVTFAHNMPETPKDILDLLKEYKELGVEKAVIENVGGYQPGNSGPAAVKFGRHMGHLDMALLALGYSIERVTPRKWMTAFAGTVPKGKKERKNKIKALAQERFPTVKVTLLNADALGILWWATQ